MKRLIIAALIAASPMLAPTMASAACFDCRVILSDHARHLLRAAATAPTFREIGHRNEKGEWVGPMSEETIERLRSHQFSGETESDAVERPFSKAGG
jgi:hypothetical protein